MDLDVRCRKALLDIDVSERFPAAMTRLARTLADYARYHRDHRNVMTHALGIPLIVLSLNVLLARPVWMGPVWIVTPSVVFSVLAAIFYLKLDFRWGSVMTVLLALLCWAGFAIAQISTTAWLGGGAALFVGGWALQFLGHHYEGRKPAFVDDMKSLLVGPLFVAAEAAFALGLARKLRDEIAATP